MPPQRREPGISWHEFKHAWRTRIVVTQPDKIRLQHFDRVLLFEDGCIVAMGPPAEVMETWSQSVKGIAWDSQKTSKDQGSMVQHHCNTCRFTPVLGRLQSMFDGPAAFNVSQLTSPEETESFKRIQAQVDEEEVQVLAKGSSPALAPRMDVALAVKEANEAGTWVMLGPASRLL